MRKILLFVIFCFSCLRVCAQYVPTSNQGYQYMSVYNPGFSGIENFGDVKLSYLSQWGNLPGSPKTINLVASFRLNQPLDLSNSSIRPSSTAAFNNPSFIPKRKRIIHAIGGNFFTQTYGPMTLSGVGLSYAFHYPISKNVRLSGGVSGIMESVKIDGSIVFADGSDPYIAYLNSNKVKQTNLNVRAGLVLYGKNFYVGASYFPIVNKAIESTSTIGDHPFYRASLQTGYSFPASASLTLKPSVIALLQVNNGLAIDYSLKAYIQNKLMIGLAYRDIKTGVVYLGLNINEHLGITYSYELSLNGFRQFNDGSHELVLALRINNYKKNNPYLW